MKIFKPTEIQPGIQFVGLGFHLLERQYKGSTMYLNVLNMTKLSLWRVIFQCLFMTTGFNKPSNDLSSFLPQSLSLFIVTVNYPIERLHHFCQQGLQLTGRCFKDVLGTTSSFRNTLLWLPLFLSKNRTALANPMSKLEPKNQEPLWIRLQLQRETW